MHYINTFDKHKKQQEISVEDYYRSLRLNLADGILKKKIIYLDTKFWIFLRNGNLEPKKHPIEKELLDVSMTLVKEGKCVFPISENVFFEVIKQEDERTLKATIKLIDRLSLGISSISYNERVNLELLHLFYSSIGRSTYRVDELIWTKLTYGMGVYDIENRGVDEDTALVLRKAFMDQMWSITMFDMISIIKRNGGLQKKIQFSHSDKLNKGKFKYANEANTFKAMYLNEAGGLIDSYKKELSDMMLFLYEKETKKSFTKIEYQQYKERSGNTMVNLIYNMFRLGKINKQVPSIRILASLHAAVRWDKQQKFQDNDFHDFQHATTALPYCDYFFTEKRLLHLLSQKLLGFNKLYNCEIQSNITEVKKTLTNLL